MQNDNGRQSYTITLNNDELKKGAREAANLFNNIGDKAVSEGNRIDKAFENTGRNVMAALGGISVGAFVKQMFQVRAEFQDAESAMTLFLGSADKAGKFMKELQDYAWHNAFEFSDLVAQSKQLLAFGNSAESVIPTLDRLSNVAIATKQPLGQLVDLYNKAKNIGTIDLRGQQQWAAAGLVLNDVLKEMGENVDGTAISFEQLEKVLDNVTSEGGRFHKQMEVMMQNLSMSYGQLQDDITNMFNEIGIKMEGTMKGGIEFASTLVSNYEKVGKAIAALIATYGTYRTAVMLLTIAQRIQVQMQLQAALSGKALTTAQALQAVATRGLTKAWSALNNTMLANPFVAIATLAVGIATTMWALRDSVDATDRALKNFNDTQSDFQNKQSENSQKINELINTIKDENETIYEKIRAYDELKSRSSALTEAYTLEELKIIDLAEATKLLNKERDKENYQEILNNVDRLKNKLAELDRKLNETPSWNGPLADLIYGRKKIEEEIDDTLEELMIYNRLLKESEDRIKQEKNKKEQAKPVEIKLAKARLDLSDIEKDFEEARKVLEEEQKKAKESPLEYFVNPLTKIRFDTLKNSLKEQEKIISDFEGQLQKTDPIKNKNYWEEQKKSAEAALNAMDQSKKGTKEWNEQLKNLNEATKALETWRHSDSKNKTDYTGQIDKEKQNRERQIKDMYLALDQIEIDAKDEGLEKTLKQNEHNYDVQKEQIARQIEDRLKQIQDAERTIWESENPDADKSLFKPKTTQLPKEDTEYFDALEKAASEAWGKSNKEAIQKLVNNYQTYAERRKQIEEKFQKEIAALQSKNTEGQYNDNIKEAEKQKNQALAELDDSVSKTKTSIVKAFDDMREKSVSEMRAIVNEAEEMLKFITEGAWDEETAIQFGIATEAQFMALNEEWAKSPDILEAIRKKINELREEADKSENAFIRMGNGLKKVFDSGDNNKKLKEGLNEVSSGLSDITTLANMFANALKNIGELSGSDIFGDIADGLGDVLEVADSVMSGAQAGSSFGTAGAIVGAVIGLVSSVTNIFNRNKKQREEVKRQLKENQLQEYLGTIEINQLWRERYEWAQKIGESTLNWIKRQGEELKKQTLANAKDQNDLWEKLMNTEYKASERSERYGLFKGKTRIVTEWDTLAGKTWEEIEELAAQGRLSEEGMKFYEALKAAKEEGDDLAARQEEYLEQVRELITGSTYDGVVNGIVEGFKAGKRSAADFADTFDELMQNAVTSALSLLTDEKMRKWYEDFARLGEDGYTSDEIAQAKADYLALIEQLAADAAALEQVTGIIIGNSERQASQKGFASMSQDTGEELNGRFTAIQSHTYSISENLKIMLPYSKQTAEATQSIQNTMDIMRSNTNIMIGHLAAIEDNTYRLHSIQATINDLNTRGIKIRS